jgi:tetratricopeptide (TPR) repeat protein
MTIHLSSNATSPVDSALARWQQQDAALTASDLEGAARRRGLRYTGLQLWREGQLEEAAKFLITAAIWAPKDAMLLGELGSLLCALGRMSEAMGYLTASLELNPNQVQVWLTAGCLCSSINEFGVAEQAFSSALELDPSSADAAAGLGLVTFEVGRIDEAVMHLTRAVIAGMNSVQVFGTLAQALQHKGEFGRAADMYRRAAQACPEEVLVQRKHAQARLIEHLARGGDVDAALDTYAAVGGALAEERTVARQKAADFLRLLGHGSLAARLD